MTPPFKPTADLLGQTAPFRGAASVSAVTTHAAHQSRLFGVWCTWVRWSGWVIPVCLTRPTLRSGLVELGDAALALGSPR